MKIIFSFLTLLICTTLSSQVKSSPVKFHSVYVEARIPVSLSSLHAATKYPSPAVGINLSLFHVESKVNALLGAELSYSSYNVDDLYATFNYTYKNFEARELTISPVLSYIISLSNDQSWYLSPRLQVDIPIITTRQYDYVYDRYQYDDNGELQFVGTLTEHHNEELSFRKVGGSLALNVGRQFKLKNNVVSVELGYRLAHAIGLAPGGGEVGNEGITMRFSYFLGQEDK